MTVWIENPFDNLPREGSRPLRFWLMARAFVRMGHRVVYWTSDFSHTTKARRRLPAAFADEGVEVRLVPTPPYRENVGFARIRSHRAYARAWEKAAFAADYSPPPNALIVSTPPLATGDAAIRLARRFGAKLVVDVMDAWPETFYRLLPRFVPAFVGRALFASAEAAARRLYRAADLVTGVADRYGEIARTKGARAYRRFYHGIELPAAEPPTARKGTDALSLLYIGNMGTTYDLPTVVRAMTLLPNATLDLAGAGSQSRTVERLIRELGLDGRVRYHGQLDATQMGELLRRADVGIMPMGDESFVGVPYKFADYAAAGLAIVSSLGGETADLLAHYGAGVAYRRGDARSLAEAVNAVRPRLGAMKSAAFALAREELDARRIYAEYVRLVESFGQTCHGGRVGRPS